MTTIGNLLAGLLATTVLAIVAVSYGPQALAFVSARADAATATPRVESLARTVGTAVERQTLANGFTRPRSLTCANAECSRIVELPGLVVTGGMGAVRMVDLSDDDYQVVVTSGSGRVTATYDSTDRSVTSVRIDSGAIR